MPSATAHAPSAPWRRAVRGTALLAAVGAGVGAVVGTLLLASLLAGDPRRLSWLDVQLGAAAGGPVGAVVGAVGAPLLGWLVLRPVPLGRAIVATALGTVLGTALGAGLVVVLDPRLWRVAFTAPIYGGLAGFVVGALLVRAQHVVRAYRATASHDDAA